MQKDTGFNEKLVTYLYALEVRACVPTGSELAWLNGRAYALCPSFSRWLPFFYIECVIASDFCMSWTPVKYDSVWRHVMLSHVVLYDPWRLVKSSPCSFVSSFQLRCNRTSTLLFLRSLQVQQLVESGDESSLGDVQEAYDIPQEKAELIVEVSMMML